MKPLLVGIAIVSLVITFMWGLESKHPDTNSLSAACCLYKMLQDRLHHSEE